MENRIKRQIRYRSFLFQNFHFPRFLRKFDRVLYRINIFFDSAPIVKSDETEKDWLKRIPNKYAFRHANYTYRQALGLYKEISLRDSMRNTKNLSKKEKKIYKEYLHITQLLYQQAKDLYDDVEIRARLAI